MKSRRNLSIAVLALAAGAAGFGSPVAVWGQLSPEPAAKAAGGALLTDPSMAPGTAFLFDLEAKFARDTAAGGGKAFASYFAEDAVALSNGQSPVKGHEAIARGATWSPASYQLAWTPQGGQMDAAGDMGFTWGHYEGRTIDHAVSKVTDKGRYMTVWKKQSDGVWKVELDSSNNEPPDAAECCKVP